MPGPKSPDHSSKTGDTSVQGQQQLFASTNLLGGDALKEQAKNRLAELRELKKQIEEEERIAHAILGQSHKFQRASAVRTGLRNYIKEAMISGQKMKMTEIAQSVESQGYEPKKGGTVRAVDQALRAMKNQGLVEHLKDDALWRWVSDQDPPQRGRKKAK